MFTILKPATFAARLLLLASVIDIITIYIAHSIDEPSPAHLGL